MIRSNNPKFSAPTLIALWFIVLLAGASLYVEGAPAVRPAATTNNIQGGSTSMNVFNDLFEQSLKEKKGLNFFIKGQTIGGAVTKIIGNEAVEVRNQTYSRIIIRIDQIDAVAIN